MVLLCLDQTYRTNAKTLYYSFSVFYTFIQFQYRAKSCDNCAKMHTLYYAKNTKTLQDQLIVIMA